MRVSAVVREILAVTGLNQTDLSKEIGVSQGTVSKWLSEKQFPNKRQWDAALELISGDSRLVHLLTAAGGPTFARVPLIDFVSAGRLADPATQIPAEDARLLAFADLGPGDFFALTVQGDSMDRVSPDGSIIVVNRFERDLVPERAFVFSVRGGTTYKLWRPEPPHLAPHSWNAANKSHFIKEDSEFEVIGRVRLTILDL